MTLCLHFPKCLRSGEGQMSLTLYFMANPRHCVRRVKNLMIFHYVQGSNKIRRGINRYVLRILLRPWFYNSSYQLYGVAKENFRKVSLKNNIRLS